MRFLALLPIVGAVAYSGAPLEARDVISNSGPNSAGSIIGIYALCGATAVDCGSGYCCLKGQTCTTVDKDTIKCADPDLGTPANPAIVNAAYYGAMQSAQVSPSKGPMSTASSYPTSVMPPISSAFPSSYYSHPSPSSSPASSSSSSTNSTMKIPSSTGSAPLAGATGSNITNSIQNGLNGGSSSGSGSGGVTTVQQVTTNSATSVQKSATALVCALVVLMALL